MENNVRPLSEMSSVVKGFASVRQSRIYVTQEHRNQANQIALKYEFKTKGVTMQTTPWQNYALITYLAGRAPEMNLGKTKLQKLIYFLKTVKNIPLDYSYRFYTYGPYCDELAGDLSYLSAVDALEISFDAGRFGYAVRKGKHAVIPTPHQTTTITQA